MRTGYAATVFGAVFFLSTALSAQAATSGLITVSYRDTSGVAQIFTVAPDGSQRTQLTNNSLYSTFPAWSPDGKYIAYVAHGNDQIRVMNADGSNDRALTDYASDGSMINATPRWSPDGTKIAYTSGVRTSPDIVVWPNTHIWVMNADGSGKMQLTSGDFADLGPTWSPDGKTIVLSSSRGGGVFHIWKMNADGTNVVQITTSGTDPVSGYPMEQKVPMWSPDGAYIVYWEGVEESHLSRGVLMGTAQPTAADKQIVSTWHIHIMNADGSGARTLVGGR
jgi:TolB protein